MRLRRCPSCRLNNLGVEADFRPLVPETRLGPIQGWRCFTKGCGYTMIDQWTERQLAAYAPFTERIGADG